MASIRKIRGRWQVRWKQPNGDDASRGGFRTRVAAESARREIEDTVAGGGIWEPRDARARANLREIAAAYLKDCLRRLRPITVKGYARAIESFLTWLQQADPSLNAKLLQRPVLLEYFDHLSSTNARAGGAELARKRAPSTSVKRLLELHAWWTWAHDADERWPGLIAPPRKLGLEMPTPAAVVAPTWAEMDACIAAAQGPQRKAAILMRFTGLRVGQVMRLRWDDFDLEGHTLRIRPELGKSKAERTGRRVPLSPHLVAELAGWGQREGWIVPSFREPGPLERTFRARDLARAWERAGVRVEAWGGRPDHAFRKGFRSGLKRAGADSEAIEFLLGHKIGEGEQDTYTDPASLPLVDAISEVPALAIPLSRPSDPAMDRKWIKVIAGAVDPEEKARLRAVPREVGFADGGTRARLTRNGGRKAKIGTGGGS